MGSRSGVIILALFVALADYCLSESSLRIDPVLTQDIERATTPKVRPASGAGSSTDTANWKTYGVEKDGFEFKYPETWSMRPRLTSCPPPSRFNLPILRRFRVSFFTCPSRVFGI